MQSLCEGMHGMHTYGGSAQLHLPGTGDRSVNGPTGPNLKPPSYQSLKASLIPSLKASLIPKLAAPMHAGGPMMPRWEATHQH